MDRLFLDANVLFSASYKPGSRLLALWERDRAQLVSSGYAVEEARRNLALVRPSQIEELDRLLAEVVLVPEPGPDVCLPEGTAVAEKDRPIVAAAVAARATHLLTGDKDHFGAFFGRRLGGVLVLTPSAYLLRRPPLGTGAEPDQAP